jgi:general secretion pathway protein D
LLKDLPLIGPLFGTTNSNNQKTEMLVLITPYIIADDHDAQEITQAFRNQLGAWAQTLAQPAPPIKKPVDEPQPKQLPAPLKSDLAVPATPTP